jgi:hypothetical protein
MRKALHGRDEGDRYQRHDNGKCQQQLGTQTDPECTH